MSIIDAYLEKLKPQQRAELQRIRRIVHEMAPSAVEVITYGMPGFKYNNKYFVAFNSLKDHLGLYPTSGPITALQDKLTGYRLSKGTIRFTVDNPLPEALIKDILRTRMATIDQ